MDLRVCKFCKIEKEYPINFTRLYSFKCKDCRNKSIREKNSLKQKRPKQTKEEKLIKIKEWQNNNHDKRKVTIKKYHENHKDDEKIYYKENRDKILIRVKNYRLKNREVLNKKLKLKRSDPIIRLRHNISCLIRWHMKKYKSGISLIKYISFTIQELKEHLEKQFEPWMNWDNYGVYDVKKWNDADQSTWTWQIDHITPQYKLPYHSMNDENFKKCWGLDNLRPLSAKQNILDGTNRIR